MLIGIDVGATNIKLVLMEGQRVLEIKKVATPKDKKGLITTLKKNIRELSYGRAIERIGVGVPGLLNKKRDLILNPPNLKCLWNCPLAKIIEKSFKIKTEMENDANCFALGEAVMGAGKKAKVVFGITLGTGLGGGLIVKSKRNQSDYVLPVIAPQLSKDQKSKIKSQKPKVEIYQGIFGSSGEVGHMTIKFDGVWCSCGNQGCLEEYASEKFIKRKTNFSPEELEKRAKKGEKNAQEIYRELGRNLGIGLANVVNLLDLEIIIIGGGLAKAGELIFRPARKEMKKRILSPFSKKFVRIKRGELGEIAGAIGAALLRFKIKDYCD